MPVAIVGLIATLGVPGLVTSAGGLTALGGVLSAGIGLGLNFAASLLLPGPSKPKPKDVQGVVRASVSARARHYGRGRWGGSLSLIESQEGALYQVVCLGQGPIDAIETYIVDDRLLTVDVDGWATSDPYGGITVQILSRLGTTTQAAYQPLIDNLPTGVWTSEHRARGIADALLIANPVTQEAFATIYPNRIPTLNVIGRGALVFDPRDSSTAWSSNLPLCLRDYLTSEEGARIPASMIDDVTFAAAADIADEDVPIKAGGTIKRYHGALSYSFDEEPRSVLERFLAAMDGRTYLTPEGKIGLLVGKWVAPTVTITDDHILEYDMEDGSGAHLSANEILVKYTQVEANYAETTADAWRDETSIAAYGVLSRSPEIYEIQHHNHARRIAKILAHRANPRWKGTIRTHLFGMHALDQRWITVQLGDLDIDEDFEVMGFKLDTTTSPVSVILTVQSFSSDAYDFNPATEEGTAPAVPDDVEETPIPEPASVVLSGTTDLVELAVSTPPSPALEIQAQWRRDPSGNWKDFPLNDDGLGETGPVAASQDYRARARYRSAGRQGAWVLSNILEL